MTDIPKALTQALHDRYRIERKLGQGGMGAVYLAEDLKHRRKVAVKVLPPELAAALGKERFLREIKIAAGLDHPHILPLHDSGEAEGLFYYVMPYVEGESLRDRLDREKQLPLEDALQIAREVADALAYAHRQDVVHRDIKPDNIMLSGGHARVADFGIARAVTEAEETDSQMPTAPGPLTSAGQIIGTPAYMSPEQVSGSLDIDGRSDLYSLGCVLYEMLAGHPPFQGPIDVLYRQHMTAEPPAITTLRPAVPPAVAAALTRALAKTPADRYSPVGQFSEALRPVASATPSPESPASAPPKKRSQTLLYAVIAVVVILGGVGLARVLHLGPWSSLVSQGLIEERERVILADFENLTEDPIAGATVTELMRIGLSRSQTISLVDPGQVGRFLDMMERDPADGLGPDLAREAAERNGIRAVITGEIAEVGERFALTARLEGVDGAVLVAERSEAEDANGITAAVDRLTGKLREKAGETISRAEAAVPLDQVTTGSLDALRTFTQGLRANNQGDQTRAMQLIEEAIAADSTFAMAYRKLAILLNNEGEERAKAVWAAEKAYEYRDRLTDREKYLVTAAYHSVVTGDIDKTISAYRTLLDLYPDDHYGLNNLGVIYGELRDHEKAEEYYRRALDVDGTLALHYTNLANTLGKLREFDASDSVADSFAGQFPDNPLVKLAYVLNNAQQGNYDEASVLVKGLLDDQKGTVYWEAIAYEWWGHLDAMRGQMTTARSSWREAMRITESREAGGAYVLRTARRAMGERFLLDDPDAARQMLDDALAKYPLESLSPLDRPYGNLAMAYAVAGSIPFAKQLIEEYERTPEADHSTNGERWAHGARGVIAFVEGRSEDAIAAFKKFDKRNSCETCGDPWLARAYDQAGRPDLAAEHYRRFVDTPSSELWYDNAHFLHSLRTLGRYYEERGQVEDAKAIYGRLARLYENAEPEFQPIHREAVSALTRLSDS